MKLTQKSKKFLIPIVGILIFAGLYYFGVFDRKINQTQTIEAANLALPDAPKLSSGENVPMVEFPEAASPSGISAKPFRIEVMAWNSQMGLMAANLGAVTQKGSICEKNGVRINIIRQDNCDQMKADLVAFASSYKDDPNTSDGIQMTAIMGDGAGAFLAGIYPQLEKLGPDYVPQIFFSMGKSYGEDALMAPISWREDANNARGKTVACYLRDGDQNIALKWAADNGIPVNPDPTTYDRQALNFVSSVDFVEAAQKYITGYKESRIEVSLVNGKVVKKGKTTIGVDAVATWTPGDVAIAESNKGGLVKIVSTKEYSSQMPNVLIGIKKHLEDNRASVQKMILSITQGGDQVKTYDQVLTRAAQVSAEVYKEKDGAYWKKYFKGVKQEDTQGLMVDLGGSRVHNLADNFELFGMSEGGTNTYAAVYKVFGDIITKLYPNDIPSYPEIDKVLDLSYLRALKSSSEVELTTPDKVKYKTGEISDVVAKRPWSITFQTGSAQFSPQAYSTLEDLYNQLLVAEGLKIEVNGYTDNVGDPQMNQSLSEQRANAVKDWLVSKSKKSFPDTRIQAQGFGEDKPLSSNDTENGRSQNRRVEILMGK